MLETKIIGKNDSIDIKYYDILYFCEKKVKEYISKSEENLNEFKEFRKKYKTFDPYFDFVFLKLDYILKDPLFYHDTYLLAYKNKYYINSCEEEDIINERTYKPVFTFDFLPSEEKHIERMPEEDLDKVGFYIDIDGNVYSNYYSERHLKLARIILNNLLIKNADICLKYKKYIEKYGEYKMEDFLIEKLGFVVGFPSNQNIIVYNEKKLTNEQAKKLIYYKNAYKAKTQHYDDRYK